jgi:hypothetical protein
MIQTNIATQLNSGASLIILSNAIYDAVNDYILDNGLSQSLQPDLTDYFQSVFDLNSQRPIN